MLHNMHWISVYYNEVNCITYFGVKLLKCCLTSAYFEEMFSVVYTDDYY